MDFLLLLITKSEWGKKKKKPIQRSNVIHLVLWEGLHDSRETVGGKIRRKEAVKRLV